MGVAQAGTPTSFSSRTGPARPAEPQKPKLLDRLREALRSRHYSPRTEQTYRHWVKRFIFFHNVRHPAEMAEPEINAFLTGDKRLMASLTIPLQEHLKRVKAIHERDGAEGWGRVQMPTATPGPSRRQDHDDLYPCPQSRTGRCSQSGGRAVSQSRRVYYADPHKMPR